MCTNPNEIQQTQKYSKKRPLIHGKKPKLFKKTSTKITKIYTYIMEVGGEPFQPHYLTTIYNY